MAEKGETNTRQVECKERAEDSARKLTIVSKQRTDKWYKVYSQ